MSTKGAGQSEGWGSVALSVLERCPVPLLTGNPHSLPLDPGVGFARILVPLDGTEYSARILPSVAAIALQQKSEVVLLLVDPRAESADDVSADELNQFKQRLEAAGVTAVKTVARIGDEAQQILDTVQTEAIDLLALTSHSRPDKAKRYFGSVTGSVVKACTCPLLLERIPAQA
jgi:nucleotide-binding universal stress UspA family protein